MNTPSNPRLLSKNLGVTFDSELGMDLHADNISLEAVSINILLRQLRSIRRSLSTDAAKTLVHSLISSRVDYYYSIFYGATEVVVRRLQSVLNAAARLISKFETRTGGSSTISLLCWEIISTGFPSVSVSTSRSQSLFTTPFMVVVQHTSAALAILSERSAPGLTLRSAIRGDLTVPRTRTRRFGPRSFRVLGPVDRLELTARRHSNSGTVAGTFQIYVENTFISPCICLAALTALL